MITKMAEPETYRLKIHLKRTRKYKDKQYSVRMIYLPEKFCLNEGSFKIVWDREEKSFFMLLKEEPESWRLIKLDDAKIGNFGAKEND